MNTGKLLEKPLQIEFAVGQMHSFAIQAMLRDAENLAIEMEQKYIEALEHADNMSPQLEVCKAVSGTLARTSGRLLTRVTQVHF